eukprot:355159_1
MDLKQLVQSIRVLNIDNEESTISPQQLISPKKTFNNDSFIISDADEELIILIEFQHAIDLHSIKLYSISFNDSADRNIYTSQPKQVHIYKLYNLNVVFDDIKSMKKNKSIKCTAKKMTKGQVINLKRSARDALQFKTTKYLAIYIESNQNDSENTHLNGIQIKGTDGTYNKNKIIFEKKVNTSMNDNTNIEFNETDTQQRSKMEILSKCFEHTEFKENQFYSNRLQFSGDKSSLSKHEDCNLSDCSALNRTITVLNRYHLLQLDETKDDIDSIFDDNYDVVCTLNDFHHLLNIHSNAFEEIYNNLLNCYNGRPCKLAECCITKRNSRDRSKLTINDVELKLLYRNNDHAVNMMQQQTLDRIHCYYLHSFDSGYKISIQDTMQLREIADSIEIKQNNNDMANDKILKAYVSNFLERKKQSNSVADSSKFSTETDEQIKYSFGFRFFYWDYYSKNNGSVDPVQGGGLMGNDEVANAGYVLREFYVAPMFHHLKQELINNSICAISKLQWDILLQNAERHIKTEHFQTFVCDVGLADPMDYYQLAKYASITTNHLVAMMLYCNNTKLQQKFSETFRLLSAQETVASLVKRHSHYAQMGKLLRECVECFSHNKWNLDHRLYHGISIQSQFSSMSAYIKGPVSTSISYAVAVHFCAKKGMILEFSLDQYFGHNGSQCFFECCYLSDFASEQEVFFIGGYSKFLFESIVIAPSGKNYELYVFALATISEISVPNRLTFKKSFELTDIQKQMCYRILLNQIHIHHPNDKQYPAFGSMPEYARGLVNRHFAHIKALKFDKYTNDSSLLFLKRLFDYLFCYDYGWIKLHLLTKVFPSLKNISLWKQSDNEQFLEHQSIFLSVLSILKNNKENKLERIYIAISGKDQGLFLAKKAVARYQSAFKKFHWRIGISNIAKNLIMESLKKSTNSVVRERIKNTFEHSNISFLK